MGAIRDLNLNFISESETEKEQDSPTSEDSKNAGSVDTFGRKVNKSSLIEGSTTSPRDKILLEKKLIAVDQRDTIVAEKLSSTVTISKINNAANAIKDEDFIDPFIGMERQKSNYNS